MIRDLAWAAGIIDGEGCVSICRVKARNSIDGTEKNFVLHVQVNMCHFPTVRRLFRIFKTGSIQSYKAEKILAAMWPYLTGTDKADQAMKHAVKLDAQMWITGQRSGRRRQLKRAHRGLKPGTQPLWLRRKTK